MKVTNRDKKKVKFRISFIFLFIIASFVACFTLYMRDDFVITEDMFEEEVEDVVYIESVGQSLCLINPVPLNEKKGEDYYDSAVFIGSKSLAGLSDYGYVKSGNMLLSDSIKLQNFNTVILSENGVENTIAESVLKREVQNVYIMVGLYEVGNINESETFEQLDAFVDTLKESNPEIKIYLMSVLPVPSDTEAVVASNADIDAYNSLLLKFADRVQVNYLDINTEFKGNDGKLPASAAEINGLRLKEESYGRMSDYILRHVAE